MADEVKIDGPAIERKVCRTVSYKSSIGTVLLFSSCITSSTTSEFMKDYALRLVTGKWGTFCINLGTGSVGNQE